MTITEKIKTIDNKNRAKQSSIQFREKNYSDLNFIIRKSYVVNINL